MKILTNIVAVLLGLIFNVFALNFFFHFLPMPPSPPADSPPGMFMGALIPTGYFAFIKIVEITGGILVMIPRTRPIGLLFLGPVVVNILCFHGFLTKGAGIFPVPTAVAAMALFLLWESRGAYRHLLLPKQGGAAVVR